MLIALYSLGKEATLSSRGKNVFYVETLLAS